MLLPPVAVCCSLLLQSVSASCCSLLQPPVAVGCSLRDSDTGRLGPVPVPRQRVSSLPPTRPGPHGRPRALPVGSVRVAGSQAPRRAPAGYRRVGAMPVQLGRRATGSATGHPSNPDRGPREVLDHGLDMDGKHPREAGCGGEVVMEGLMVMERPQHWHADTHVPMRTPATPPLREGPGHCTELSLWSKEDGTPHIRHKARDAV